MAKSAKVFHGARAKVFVKPTENGTPQLVGIFDSCSYSVNIGAEAIHILGRFSPDEITQTSYEAVQVSCSGFRIIGNGAHVLPAVPKLQDLLNLEYVTLTMEDRQDSSNQPIMTVENCIPVNYSTGAQAKSVSRVQITYLGTHASDEAGTQNESSGAASLPS